MSAHSGTTVAVDLMGGDEGPGVVFAGIQLALAADPDLRVLAVGPEGSASELPPRVELVVATEVVGMDEHPANAVRSRPDSSMSVGCRLIKEERAQAFFSAGNTGAALAAALFTLGRIRGVKRPALATVVPATSRVPVLLDIGANADCLPEHLLQFAFMGREYASATLGIEAPSVGLLNIGEEASKGSKLALEAHELMAASVPDFFGNVEGRDIPAPPVDVIVTDGFTGNVAIKLLEGTAKTLMREVAGALTSSAAAKVGALAAKSRLHELKDRLNPDRYGGAPLLGVAGVCIVGHGSSNERAIASGIAVAAMAARQDLTGRIATALG